METIQSVFMRAGAEVDFKADKALIERLAKYEREFVNRDEDHVNFFGGNLVGVYQMKFRQQDRDNWFFEIINLDELDLIDAIKKVSYLDPKWKRPNDPMNLSCVWLMHLIYHSKTLSAADKKRGMELVVLVLLYKFMGSILSHSFKYVADKAMMEATMASLSYKYEIKTVGSWGALFHKRAEEIASPRSIHHKAYVNFNSDYAITYMINDIQGRLRELIKNIWAVFDKVRKSDTKWVTEKSVITFDGDTFMRDKVKKYSTYMRYAHEVVPERRSFVRDELTSVVLDLMHTVSERYLIEALEWMSLNYRVKKHEFIEELVEETLLHCFGYIQSDRATYGKQSSLDLLLAKLRALYTASRMSDPQLLKARDLAGEVVKHSVTSKNPSVQAGCRTAVQLYVVIRTLAMHHYQQ